MKTEPKEEECGEAWHYAQPKWKRALHYMRRKAWNFKERIVWRFNHPKHF